MRLARGVRVLLVALLASAGAAAQHPAASPRPTLTIPRLERPPTIDEFLGLTPDETFDTSLARVDDFIQQIPNDGAPPTQLTRVYAGYDDKNLYVIFICFDSEPALVRGRLGRREDIFSDDRVEVWLDTFQDRRRAYVFATNSLGTQRDATWTEGRGFDGSFDTLWHTDGRLTDHGYVVWMAIPFKSLRFPNTAEQSWGVIFKRDVGRYNEDVFWPRVSSRVESQLAQAATLRGLSGISPGRNMQFIPYASFRSFRALDLRDPAAPRFQQDDGEFDAGLDAKFVLKDSLVLDVALNPDFSQVESDQPQVTVNQRFEVFFPEKRPFFIENANYFETPIDLVFTRRIADPQLGARLTGKLGPYALGALVIDDASPGRSRPDDDPLHDDRALFSIFRVSRDVAEQSAIGFLYTGREFKDSYNRVGGLDGRFKLSPNWVASFQGVTSWTRFLDGSTLAGPAYDAALLRSGRSLTYELEYNDRSPGFRTLTGFVPRPDIRRVGQTLTYLFWPEDERVSNWGPSLMFERIYDHDGTRLDWEVEPSFAVNFTRQTTVEVGVKAARERLRPQDVDGLTRSLDFSRSGFGVVLTSSYFSLADLSLDVLWENGINFAPLAGQEPFPVDQNSVNFLVTLRPTSSMRVDNSYLLLRLRDQPSGESVLNNHILRTNWNYQFTRELSIRVILQYDATLANPAHTRLETRKNFNADFLFTYLLHPGTALFIGYNGNAQNVDLVGNQLLRPRDRFSNDAKQFFVKFSYLFRF